VEEKERGRERKRRKGEGMEYGKGEKDWKGSK